ncbi:hypothetical protein LOTGIDRAFT_232049 [Lottia gigantea]|uniref:PrdX deacylase domain-containing protein 1 n=1 Tax=Lottia gigantea TaxID=225164 RepID=V4C1P3_LOTGI|nr:hypothetical protein LOTGIDRAFT_232049 [Lottia gigantea]ESO95354.1 hypothetical protein LOTGIDRAFT_232049 [Lottia gigantea]
MSAPDCTNGEGQFNCCVHGEYFTRIAKDNRTNYCTQSAIGFHHSFRWKFQEKALVVPATVKMDNNTMHRGNVKEFPNAARPLWSLAVGESLILLNMMNNNVYFNSFPFIASTWLKDIFTIIKDKTKCSISKGHSLPGQAGKFSTFQSYLNTVPRINLVSDEVYSQINPGRIDTTRRENEEIGTKDEIMQMCSGYTEADVLLLETGSDTSLNTGDKDWENPQNIPLAEVNLKDDVSAIKTHSLLHQSTSQQSGLARAPSAATNQNLRCNEYETEAMRQIKDILEGIDREHTSDEDDDDVTFDQINLDEIQTLKIKSNEYIRNDFDLMSSKRLPFFDPINSQLPRYNEDLGACLLAELLNSFGMKYKISKYKDKPNRLNSDEIFCKNLFLKDRKGQYYYIICNEDQNFNLKKAAKFLGAHRNLSFASESDTNNFMHVERGGLTPFALLYDRECKIKVVCTTDLLLEADQLFNFHPFDANLTLCLRFDDLINFLAIFNHSVDFLPI